MENGITATGNPKPEELAAVVAVLMSRPAAAVPEKETATSLWSAPEARFRRPLHPGPGAWRAAL